MDKRDKVNKKDSVFSENINYDTRKGLNRSTEVIPEELVNSIMENGISIEDLEELEYPVFKYTTQITIHGLFDIPEDRYVLGNYVNLIRNKNGSLGVKYNAIDFEKKEYLRKACVFSEFNFHLDSKGCSITLIKTDVEEIKALYLQEVTFIGSKNVYKSHPYFGDFYMLEYNINAIYWSDLWTFIAHLTKNNVQDKKSLEYMHQKHIEAQEAERERFHNEMKEMRAQTIKEYQPKFDAIQNVLTGIPNKKEFVLKVHELSGLGITERIFYCFVKDNKLCVNEGTMRNNLYGSDYKDNMIKAKRKRKFLHSNYLQAMLKKPNFKVVEIEY